MTAAQAEARQSIGTSVTRQASQGSPREPEQFMQIGTVKKVGNLSEGRISQNKQKAMKKNRHHNYLVYSRYSSLYFPKWRTFIDEDYRDLFKFWEGYSIHQRYKNKSKMKKERWRYRLEGKKIIRNYKTYPAH